MVTRVRFLATVLSAVTGLALSVLTGGQAHAESVLFNFDGTNGAHPLSPVIIDEGGNCYGTTYAGGAHSKGTAYELSPPTSGSGNWAESTLWDFGLGKDGSSPASALVMDSKGNL